MGKNLYAPLFLSLSLCTLRYIEIIDISYWWCFLPLIFQAFVNFCYLLLIIFEGSENKEWRKFKSKRPISQCGKYCITNKSKNCKCFQVIKDFKYNDKMIC